MEIIIDKKYEYLLDKYNWTPLVSKHLTYAKASVNGKQKLLHRIIAEKEGWDFTGKIIDHKNNNGLDERVENLQAITQQQNMQKQRKFITSTSPYKGIREHRPGQFRARITLDGIVKHIGVFKTAIMAAKAYDAAATKYFGEYTTLNFQEKPCIN